MWTTGRIAALLDVRCEGPEDRVIRGVAPLESAGPEHLSFCSSRRWASTLTKTGAGAVLIADGSPPEGTVVLRHSHPRWAFATVASAMHPPELPSPGCHPSATVHPTASIHASSSLGPGSVVQAGATVGSRCDLQAHAVVGQGAVLGDDVVVAAHAVICAGAMVGDGVRIGPHAVVGAEGFGVAIGPSGLQRVPQLGTTVIEADVSIGPHCVVCRGSLGETRVGRGTQLDSFVQIAHNVRVGENCLLAAFVGLAGGVRLGDGVHMGGRAAAVDGVEVGDGARFAALASAWRDVPEGAFVGGAPARPHRQWLREVSALAKLPAALRMLAREPDAEPEEEE